MRVIKPNCLSVLPRPVEHRGQVNFCVSVMGMLSLRGTPFLFSDQNLWKTLPVAAPSFAEAGILKSRSEFLVYGAAYPPPAEPGAPPVTSATFGVRLGTLRKIGRAHGRRVVDGQTLVLQEPLQRAPLDGSGSYGGPAYPANPSGMGHPSAKRPDGLLELPRIEPPERGWHPDPQRNEALMFGALDFTHPARMALAGTYDEAWLKTDFPGLARDGKWAIHNVAPADQQHEAAFVGDEDFHLANLHPEDPQLRGRLPGLIASIVVQRMDDTLERVPATLRTVLFLPDQDRIVLIWQGHCRCTLDDGGDIQTVLVGAEHLARRKPTAHYAEVLRLRTESEDAMLESLRDDQLLPEDLPFEGLLPADLDLNRPLPEDSLEARLRRRGERHMQAARDEVASHGLDPDEHAPPAKFPPAPKLPPIAQLGEFFRQIERSAEQHREQAKAMVQQQLVTLEREFVEAGMDFSVIRREISGLDSLGPPRPNAPLTLAMLTEEQNVARAHQVPVPQLDQMLADPAVRKSWQDADDAQLEIYADNAHHQAPAPASRGALAERQIQPLLERLRRGLDLANLDLTGADLRSVDLGGVDCSGALMASCNLSGARLTGARFTGAVLAHANLSGAQAGGCDFTDANLGKADFSGADASAANFTRATLEHTRLSGAVLREARFDDAQFIGARLDGADLSGSRLDECQFLEIDLSGARLDRCSLDGAVFLSAQLGATSWEAAHGKAVSFVNVGCPDSGFRAARLPGSRWVGKIDLSGACFDGADLSNAYFAQGSRLSRARFENLKADGADFSGCFLEGTAWRGARVRDGGFRRAQLIDADIAGADLMGAMLTGAVLHGAQAQRCNLYAADLARIQIDGRTRLDDVYSPKARIYPKWKLPDAGT